MLWPPLFYIGVDYLTRIMYYLYMRKESWQ